jgi:hypothetical protein
MSSRQSHLSLLGDADSDTTRARIRSVPSLVSFAPRLAKSLSSFEIHPVSRRAVVDHRDHAWSSAPADPHRFLSLKIRALQPTRVYIYKRIALSEAEGRVRVHVTSIDRCPGHSLSAPFFRSESVVVVGRVSRGSAKQLVPALGIRGSTL